MLTLVGASIERPDSRRIGILKINSFLVPLLTLSMGIRLLPEHIERAEYYPSDSVGSIALLNSVMAGHVGAPAPYDRSFLCIRTAFGKIRVRGSNAVQVQPS